MPDTSAVMEGLADRLRVLLRSPAVVIFVQDAQSFRLHAASAETPAIGACHSRPPSGEAVAFRPGDRRPRGGGRRTHHRRHRLRFSFRRRHFLRES